MKTSIYNANRPFTVRVPAELFEETAERGAPAALAEELIKKDFNSRSRRKNKLDKAERPKFEGSKARISVHARVDEELSAKVRALLDETGIKPRDYVAELMTAHFEGRKPVFTVKEDDNGEA